MERLEGASSTRRMGRIAGPGHAPSYGGYLKVPELLSLQQLLSDPPAHDELLFIVVHQAYELWFKQLLFELETARDLMLAARPARARHLLRRVHAIERLLVEQVAILETMSPQEFLEFRSNLTPASGFQSVQFREIEFLSGLRDPSYVSLLAESDEERARLERRLREPTLWDAFRELLARSGLPMPADDPVMRMKSLLTIARSRDDHVEEWELAESLLVHDQLLTTWRLRHVLMVERQIGSKAGTGGSSGASYLRRTIDKRMFPELWALRDEL
jgi:tryptophan 2,3-dioxygenase